MKELELLIQSSGAEGTLEPAAMALLTRSIRFGEKDAADALLPRTQVEAVSIDDPIAVLVAKAIASGQSRFPVVGADLDAVRGVVHVKDVYHVAFEHRAATPVDTTMPPALAVPATPDPHHLPVALRPTPDTRPLRTARLPPRT